MNNRKYNCTQQELYAVCQHGWETFSQHIDRFAAFKTKYTAAFLKEKRAEVVRVMKMQDYHQRSSVSERCRISLKKHADTCVQTWKKLRIYIQEAWPEDEHDVILKSAGQPYYREAARFRWEAISSLLGVANTFVAENKETLLAKGMVKGFPDELSKLTAGFAQEYAKYQDSVRQAMILANEKIEANNALYAELMHMFADGRAIFNRDQNMLKFFTFDSVLMLISGPGSAGIKGSIGNGQRPLGEKDGLELILENTDESIEVDEAGTFRISQLSAGTYSLRATAPGYKPYHQEGIVVHTGTHTTVNIVMEKEEVIDN